MREQKMAIQYGIAKAASGKVFLLTKSAQRVLEYVQAHPGAMYEEIAAAADIKLNTLIVYAQRMDEAMLIRREHVKYDGRPRTQLYVRSHVKTDFKVHHI